MQLESHEVHTGQGTKLFCQASLPEVDTPRAVLFVVHGLGEHSGRYEELGKAFIKNQVAVFTFDHRGHGQSEGKRGHANSIDELVEDSEHALMKCRSIFLELPLFLFGHSLGGQVVASYLNKIKSKEIKGAIISSGWFQIATAPPSWQIKFVEILRTFFPRLTFSNRLDPKKISSQQSEVEEYRKDPLIHDRISLALFHSAYNSGLQLMHQAQPARIPVLVCHGNGDRITAIRGSEQYAHNLGQMAEFKWWPDSFHEPHHDFDKDRVAKFYVDWVTSKLN